MKWSYWYFSFEVENKEKEWKAKDSTVVSGIGGFFPIQKVFEYAREEFGEDARVTILSVLQISEQDYGYMANLLGGDDEDEPETDL